MRGRRAGVHRRGGVRLGYGSPTVGLVVLFAVIAVCLGGLAAAAARVHDWPVAIGAGALAAWMASLVVGGLRRRLSRR
jgi:hypothetical protein